MKILQIRNLFVLLHCSMVDVEQCKYMDKIIIAGKKFGLEPVTPDIRKNLWLGLIAESDIFQFAMNNRKLLLIVPKEGVKHSPVQLSKIAQRIENATQLSAVFYFENMPTYERDRMVDKGVYFVVGDKFAFVPTLIANRRLSKTEMPTQLLPSTQYLLLFHLQVRSLEGLTIKEIEKLTPYQYPTLAKSIQQLTALGLAGFSIGGTRSKQLHFSADKRELWEKVLPYLTNPIKQSGYISQPVCNGTIGGIDALSHYTMLVGENIPTRVFTKDEFKESGEILSRYEDVQRVEIWKYPPVSENRYVDRLSLYLSLRDDRDPRVEKELETMINEMPW